MLLHISYKKLVQYSKKNPYNNHFVRKLMTFSLLNGIWNNL